MGNTVAQALVLAMMDKTVVDMVTVPLNQVNGANESGNLAVVNLQPGIFHRDATGSGELVVVFVTTPLGKGTVVMVHISLGVGPADPQAGNSYIRPHGPNEGRRLEGIGVNPCAL